MPRGGPPDHQRPVGALKSATDPWIFEWIDRILVGKRYLQLSSKGFEDVRNAVQSAIAIAAQVEIENATTPSPLSIRFRMGIDLGEATVSGGRYIGEPLNIASRIQALAQPGGLCISGRVYRELDEPALRFRPIGRQRLKNIIRGVDISEFADLPSQRTDAFERKRLSLESPTVAVLPIHTQGVDESAASMAAILRADLVHRLAHVPQLKVIDAKAESTERRTANVARYMIETGIQRLGENMRLYATLFDVTTMNIVKSYKWTVQTEALFSISDRFVDDVARSAEIELIVGDLTGMSSAVEASILMVEGRHEDALAIVETLEILRPTCDVTYGLEGSVRRYMGQWEKAVELLDTAMRLTGINKPWYPTVKACSLFVGGKVEQAASIAEMVLSVQPHNLEALLVLVAAQVEMGLVRRAKAMTEEIRERFPAVDMEVWLDKNPYQIRGLVERWKKDLASAGAIAAR